MSSTDTTETRQARFDRGMAMLTTIDGGGGQNVIAALGTKPVAGDGAVTAPSGFGAISRPQRTYRRSLRDI